MRSRIAAFAGLLTTTVVVGSALAVTPGDLDAGFGSGGKVTTGIERSGSDEAQAVAVQTDGKIVAAGRSGDDFAVVRYNANGSLDSSFGGDGIATVGFGGEVADPRAVAIQANGKVVVAGSVFPPFQLGGQEPGDFALARFNANGSLDATFGGDGTQTTDFAAGSADGGEDVAIQADGRIVVAGFSAPVDGPSDFAVARYNANGSLDATFSGDGKQTTDFVANSFDTGRGVAIQADGAIVLAGRSTDHETFEDFALARYEADGDLDPTFSGDGKLLPGIGGEASDVAIASAGAIVAAGMAGDNDFAVARFEPDGDFDPSFGGGTEVTTDFGGNERANAVAIQPGGEIVLAGGAGPSGSDFPAGDFALARYEADGDLDLTFSGDGIQTTDFGAGSAAGRDMALQSDGAIVVAGAVGFEPFSEAGSDFVLTRYEPDGDLDPAFSGDGRVDTQIGGAFADRAEAVAVQQDGKIVVAGSTVDEPGLDDEDFAVARYNPDGTLDPGFGGDGVVTTDFGGGDLPDGAQAVAIQADGQIVVAGFTGQQFTAASDFAVARFNANGSLDTSFGGDGKVSTALGVADTARDVAIQPNGAIIVAGDSGTPLAGAIALARYEPDGDLDPTFSADGKLIDPFAGAFGGLGVAIQPDGAIVVAAGGGGGPDDDFALARYQPDGGPDPTFSGDGKATTDFGGFDQAHDVAIQADGAIVAAGITGAPDTPIAECAGVPGMEFALARYQPNGNPDNGFSGDGKATTDFGGTPDSANGVGIQTGGAIVAAGRASGDFALARYEPDGDLDPTLSGDGQVTTPFDAGSCDVARDLALASGRILLAGFTQDEQGSRFALARYVATVDTTPPPGDGAGAVCRGATVASITGTVGDDNLVGTAGPEAIFGLAGADRLNGLGGGDCLNGDAGEDVLKGGGGKDLLRGGAGKDRLRGQGGKDKLKGQAGKDKMNGGEGADVLAGGPGKDKLRGGPARDRIKGNAGNDRINSVDGKRDRVNCGGGKRDKAVVDPRDKVSASCEKVIVKD